MSTETSAGKPGTVATVSPGLSRVGMSGALVAVANAPPQNYMHITGGQNKAQGN
jgi:hypothetical protein